MIFGQQDVFRLDISMEDTVSMHMVNRLKKLVHVVFDSVFWEIVSLTFDGVIHIHIHEFENEGQSAGWLVI